MRLIIDTHILIWFLETSPNLSLSRREMIANGDNEVFISIASLWELSIKLNIGKIVLSQTLADVVRKINDLEIEILHISSAHLVSNSQLPLHHRDPFDRMIIAQAQVEFLDMMTNDGVFADYGLNLI